MRISRNFLFMILMISPFACRNENPRVSNQDFTTLLNIFSGKPPTSFSCTRVTISDDQGSVKEFKNKEAEAILEKIGFYWDLNRTGETPPAEINSEPNELSLIQI